MPTVLLRDYSFLLSRLTFERSFIYVGSFLVMIFREKARLYSENLWVVYVRNDKTENFTQILLLLHMQEKMG